MARDYKHRAQTSHRRRQQEPAVPLWRWLAALLLVAGFVAFLVKLEQSDSNNRIAPSEPPVAELKKQPKSERGPEPETKSEQPAPPLEKSQPEEPRYDFYTLLPQAEVVVPDYEIKTRVREELVGKVKQTQYVMQAGSFREAAEADKHKAKLALLGIEAKIEKAKVGSVIWYRIKIGPYDNPSSVAKIKELLQKNGIGVMVTESGR